MARMGKAEREALAQDQRVARIAPLMQSARKVKRDTVNRTFRLTGGEGDAAMPSTYRPKQTDPSEIAKRQRALNRYLAETAPDRAAGGAMFGKVVPRTY